MKSRDHIVRYAQALANEVFSGNFTLYVKPEDLHSLNREANLLRKYAYTGDSFDSQQPLNSPLVTFRFCGIATVSVWTEIEAETPVEGDDGDE